MKEAVRVILKEDFGIIILKKSGFYKIFAKPLRHALRNVPADL